MKTICAALIVKNESKVVKRCLSSIKNYIDYWVVCDTGSTDDTKSIVSSELSEIPGELHQVPWINFGHNRTQLLQLCKGKADYLLLIDADEILLVRDENFKEQLNLDSYLIKFEGDLEWRQKKLISNHIDWRYEGVTHEFITSNEDKNFKPTDSIALHHFCDGSRRPEKFEDDIRLLRAALKDDPKNGRYLFYLAQCLFDIGRHKKALKTYQSRIELGGWEEEVYYSMLRKAMCLKQVKDYFPISEFVEAHEFRPSRPEAIYEIIKYYRETGCYDIAYSLCKRQLSKPRSNDILFIDKTIYDYKLIDELAVCSYWVGEYEESLLLNRQLLENPYLPGIFKQRIENNKKFAESKMQE